MGWRLDPDKSEGFLSALLEQNPSLATQPTALTALRMQQNGVHEPWNALRAPGSAAA